MKKANGVRVPKKYENLDDAIQDIFFPETSRRCKS